MIYAKNVKSVNIKLIFLWRFNFSLLQVITYCTRFVDPKVKQSFSVFFDSHMNSLFLDVFMVLIIDSSQREKLEYLYFWFSILPKLNF